MAKYFITGGAGTLGKAILARAENSVANDDTFTIFSRDPVRHMKMPKYKNIEVTYIMGDIREYDAVYNAMAGHDIVIHAGAMKHIPQGEKFVTHTIDVNITGSYNVAKAALAHNVDVCVGVSTDKVCYPINVYGATKYLMEHIWREFHEMNSDVRFTLCRYGNVLGSTGSVLQVWQKQREEGSKVTITDPDHIRYWMTEAMAVDVVLLASDVASGVTVIPVVPSTDILTLARLVTGEELNESDIEIIGERPGEKQAEGLLTYEESSRARSHGNYVFLYPYKVKDALNVPMISTGALDKDAVKEMLQEIGVIR